MKTSSWISLVLQSISNIHHLACRNSVSKFHPLPNIPIPAALRFQDSNCRAIPTKSLASQRNENKRVAYVEVVRGDEFQHVRIRITPLAYFALYKGTRAERSLRSWARASSCRSAEWGLKCKSMRRLIARCARSRELAGELFSRRERAFVDARAAEFDALIMRLNGVRIACENSSVCRVFHLNCRF